MTLYTENPKEHTKNQCCKIQDQYTKVNLYFYTIVTNYLKIKFITVLKRKYLGKNLTKEVQKLVL